MLAIIFGLLGLVLLLLIEKETDYRNKKELCKANILLNIIELLSIIEVVLILVILFV